MCTVQPTHLFKASRVHDTHFFNFAFVYACTNVDRVELREYLVKEMLTTCA